MKARSVQSGGRRTGNQGTENLSTPAKDYCERKKIFFFPQEGTIGAEAGRQTREEDCKGTPSWAAQRECPELGGGIIC